MDEVKRPKRRWRLWLGGALVLVLVGYPLSFGPTFWWLSRFDKPNHELNAKVAKFYRPVLDVLVESPPSVRDAAIWYLRWGASENSWIAFYQNPIEYGLFSAHRGTSVKWSTHSRDLP